MASRRRIQVAGLIKEELGDLLQRSIKDPGLGFVTLTEVEVSADMRYARVYFSVLGDDEDAQQSLAALKRAAGYLRHELGHRMTMHRVPELHFVLDRSLEHGQRIADLLRQVREGEEPPPGE